MKVALYAIRQVGTQKYIPSRPDRNQTWLEPIETSQPRLFYHRRYAIQALDRWVEGRRVRQDNSDKLKVMPRGRSITQMEIVLFMLQEVK